ncbi:hypothetical protein Micbo1qcDRAFT_168178, partial [Microdochium bolleyi]
MVRGLRRVRAARAATWPTMPRLAAGSPAHCEAAKLCSGPRRQLAHGSRPASLRHQDRRAYKCRAVAHFPPDRLQLANQRATGSA